MHPRVLIVDDEVLVASAMRRCLCREYDVTVVDSGHAACKIIAGQEPFDVIIIDIFMPDISGPALYDWLAQHYPSMIRHVLFTTGATVIDDLHVLLKDRRCPLMPKPFTSKAIREFVSSIIEANLPT